MERQRIPVEDFVCPIISLLKNRWMLLTSGENKPGGFNTMTIGWASFGVMWDSPFAMVVVRPSRHTYGFMEKFNDFTLSVFPQEYKKKLMFCGTKSGRDVDKVRECGFTVMAAESVRAPAFDEAELVVECRKIYFDDMNAARFVSRYIEGFYHGTDYHRIYFGEIMAIQGIAQYSVAKA